MKNIFDLYYDPIDMSCCVNADSNIDDLFLKMHSDHIYFPFYQKGKSLNEVRRIGNYQSASYRFAGLSDNILGVLVANKSGVEFRIGARVVKNVTGFDFTRFFINSIEDFGEIRRAILRLRPKPDLILKINISGDANNLSKFSDIVLHSVWSSSLLSFDYIAKVQSQMIKLCAVGSEDELNLIKSKMGIFAKQVGALQIDSAINAFNDLISENDNLCHGNIIVSKNIVWGEDLVNRFGGEYKGFLGNGSFYYQPENEKKFKTNARDVLSQIKGFNGSLIVKGLQLELSPLNDIQTNLNQIMQGIQ